METEIGNIRYILLVEDDPRDVELTLAALEEHHLANKVLVVHDGRWITSSAARNSKRARGAIPSSCCWI
jgi:hypothetical protein